MQVCYTGCRWFVELGASIVGWQEGYDLYLVIIRIIKSPVQRIYPSLFERHNMYPRKRFIDNINTIYNPHVLRDACTPEGEIEGDEFTFHGDNIIAQFATNQ